jgi:hypothetical protein
MTSKQVEAQVLMSLENAACCGRTPGDYSDYCKRLTRGLMIAIEKYKETEIEKVIETVEE